MSKKLKTEEVFIQTGYPEHTYAMRDKTDMNFEISLRDGGTHIYLFGDSKSGKSSMWKNYLSKKDIIEIKVSKEITKEDFFNEIANKLEMYIETERESTLENQSELSASASGKIPVFTAKAAVKQTEEDNLKSKFLRVANIRLTLTVIVDELTKVDKVIILEDFHIANEIFVNEISSVLKAFADNRIKVILVGIINRLPEIVTAREDIKGRIKAYDVSKFKNTDLKEIINKGEACLNITISDNIKEFLILESCHKAYVLQALCRMLCYVAQIEETMKDKTYIMDFKLAERACELLASSEDATYENTVRVMSQAGRKSNKQQTYLWLLRVLKNFTIGEEGIELKDIYNKIKELGNTEMTQGSVNSCVAYIPNVLESNSNVVNVIKYENKRLYVTDSFFQFYLKWSTELCDELNIN